MNTNVSANRSEEMLCPKCKISHTIEHNDGQWVSALWIFRYTPLILDTQRTFRLSGPRAQVPSFACAQQQKQPRLVHSVPVAGDQVTRSTAFTKMVSGFVEVVARAFLREQTISELFSKKGVLTERHSSMG